MPDMSILMYIVMVRRISVCGCFAVVQDMFEHFIDVSDVQSDMFG